MRKKEQRLWDTMKRNKPRGFWLQRIENVVANGMPDVHSTSKRGTQTWVELKSVLRPKRNYTRLLGNEGLRLSQINWHLIAASKGVRSFVLIRDDHSALYLIDGVHAETLNDWPLAQVATANLGADWDTIYKELM